MNILELRSFLQNSIPVFDWDPLIGNILKPDSIDSLEFIHYFVELFVHNRNFRKDIIKVQKFTQYERQVLLHKNTIRLGLISLIMRFIYHINLTEKLCHVSIMLIIFINNHILWIFNYYLGRRLNLILIDIAIHLNLIFLNKYRI